MVQDKVNWSQTETYIGGYTFPYRLFGLHGKSCKHIKRWWFGDRSHEPLTPPVTPLQQVGIWLFIGWMGLAALGSAIPAEKVPRSLRTIYETVVVPLASLYWLAMMAGFAILPLLFIKTKYFPSQQDHERAEKYRRDVEWRQSARDLTVVLWLGRPWQRPRKEAPPLYLDRHRDSTPLSGDTLPRDRHIYVTLHDLTAAEIAEMSNRLNAMDI